MPIPKSVLRQAQRSDELIASISNAAPQGEQQPSEPQQPAPTEPAPPTQPTELGADTTSTQQPTETQEGDQGRPKGADYWRQRFLVVDGMLRAEVPRLKGQIRALEDQNKALREQNDSLQSQVQAASQSTTAPSNLDTSMFDPALVQFIENRAREIASQITGQHVKPIAQAVHETAEQQAARARIEFEDDFGQLVFDSHGVDWRQVNANPQWLAYLGQRDRMTGMVRQEILDRAVDRLDSQAVAAMFQTFLDTVGAARAPAPAPAPTPTPARPTPMVVPAPSAAGGLPASPAKPIYTRAEISAFYAEYAKAKSGRAPLHVLEQMKAKEADITLAQAEGRIR